MPNDLIERYLHAVKFWLPKAHQQDILAELAEDLRSHLDEREAAVGHAVAEEDVIAVLRQRGAPMRVASSFLPEQRLINPAMMPVYRLVLKIVLLWVLLPLFVLGFLGPVSTSAHPERVVLQFWASAWQTGFMVVGMVTVAFAVLDRYHVKFRGLEDWDPRKLPRVPAAQDVESRWNRLAGAIFGLLAAAFWVAIVPQRNEFALSGGVHLHLNPIWLHLYWPILGITLTDACLDLFAFLYPSWALVRSRMRLGLDACVIVAACLLLRVENWVDLVLPNVSAADLAKAQQWANATIQITLLFIAVIAMIDAVRQWRRLFPSGPGKPAAILTAC